MDKTGKHKQDRAQGTGNQAGQGKGRGHPPPRAGQGGKDNPPENINSLLAPGLVKPVSFSDLTPILEEVIRVKFLLRKLMIAQGINPDSDRLFLDFSPADDRETCYDQP